MGEEWTWKKGQDIQPIAKRQNSCRWTKQKIVAGDWRSKSKSFKDEKYFHLHKRPNNWALSQSKCLFTSFALCKQSAIASRQFTIGILASWHSVRHYNCK